jgi:hypothetical protein
LQRLWLLEVSKYNVLPLDDRRVERFNSDLAGFPTLVSGTQQLLFRGMGRLSENSVLNLKNKCHTITAQLSVPEAGATGVIISQGGAFGGWSLYLVDGHPRYCYNLFGLQQFHVAGEAPVPPGDHQVRVEFTSDGGGLGKGGTATLFVDGNKAAQGRVEATVPMLFVRRVHPASRRPRTRRLRGIDRRFGQPVRQRRRSRRVVDRIIVTSLRTWSRRAAYPLTPANRPPVGFASESLWGCSAGHSLITNADRLGQEGIRPTPPDP